MTTRADEKDRVPTPEVLVETRVLRWHERIREPLIWGPLTLGVFLLLLPLIGLPLIASAFPVGSDEPKAMYGEVHTLKRADGTTIHAEIFGPQDAPVLIFTHGWSTDEAEWYYAKRELAGRFRIITWDLSGLGRTAPWADQNVTLERMATDLHQVLTLSNGKPVILIGHSIGGMINLTFCHLYPQELGTRVAGVVEVDSSYTNPVRTTQGSQLNLALQKPVAEPILHAMIPLSELVRLINRLSYREGLLYLSNARSAFDGTETLGQLDMTSRYQFLSSPGVVARGTLAMFHWDMTPELRLIKVPVLMIVGPHDTTTLPAASKTMANTIAGAQLEVLSTGKHYALLEDHQSVDSAISSFATAILH
ncbi:putative hydrolase (plasmid) [Acidisarcina polymorpha]|uniref:Putative hydrolase n=1 Tax=Acidisarcina polymorpha TaxID=2211140 RepID=A0A2Z5GCF9_9BACT|nr:alpha/beta hydrolase [Acidisarcina polymorpha]AXC16305.1 putative hydrolase [Acidisarcina polymorpha]